LTAVADDVDVLSAPRPADPEAPTPSPATRRSLRELLQWALFSVPVLGYLAAGWAHRWVAEDGFIYLRIAQQITAGNGPVFNRGERVEAATGTLWVWMLALANLLTPIRLEWIAVFLGLGIGAAGLALAMLGARRLWPETASNRLFVPFGALVFVLLAPVWVFATSGFETGLAFGWLGACLWILAGWASAPGLRLATWRAVILGLGWLIRPELVMFSAAFLVLVLTLAPRGTGRRERFRIAIAMLAVPVAYQIFRMGYYGSLVPNTAIAKEGASGRWSRGWTYFKDFVDPYWLWVPTVALLAGGFLPLALAARRRRRVLAVALVFLIGALLSAVYVVSVGGDYTHARLLLPGVFALCAPVAVIPATRRHLAALLVIPWALAAFLTLRPDQWEPGNTVAHGFTMPGQADPGRVTIDDVDWGSGGSQIKWYRGPGFYKEVGLLRVPGDVPLRRSIRGGYGAFFGVGQSGYGTGIDFHVLDLLGLGDTFTAHLDTSNDAYKGPRFPGHEKPLPTPWIDARVTPDGTETDSKQFPNFFGGGELTPPTTGKAFQEQVAWARAALRCPAIKELLDAADAPMTPGRFVSNFFDSFTNTRTRIPPNPKVAYRKFCGPGIPPQVKAVQSQSSTG
jgi:arabinofuranosyltransferase